MATLPMAVATGPSAQAPAEVVRLTEIPVLEPEFWAPWQLAAVAAETPPEKRK
ncbi:hypothetical protein [Pseudacidovorax intermedius]|uniref:hypothetical protein n=1 Tax=Pseudacidovorax intermedius TaxID=433924 RepID=UPI0026EB80CC|nr:hypothetical protein [Pseudacidovorax intermedius]